MPTPQEEHDGHEDGDALPSLDGAAAAAIGANDDDEDDAHMLLWDAAFLSVEEPLPGLDAESGEDPVDPGRSSPPWPWSLSPSIDAFRRRHQRETSVGSGKLPSPNSDPDSAVAVSSSGPLLEKMQEAALESARRAEARETLALGTGTGKRMGMGRSRPRAATGPPALSIATPTTNITNTINTTQPRTISENWNASCTAADEH